MKILVTGGAGFIASHIVDAYLELGHQVLVIDNLSTGSLQNLNSAAKFVQLDITDPALAQTVHDFQPEIINHHAAQINVRASVENPSLDAQINILGSINLIESARKAGSVQKFIFASTGGAIYGDADHIPTPETYPARPISPYGIAKLSVEHYLYYYLTVHHFPYIALRYGNVFGPRQNPHGEAGVVSIFYQKILAGVNFFITGTGDQTRDFVYVKDVVAANLKATNADFTGPVNIGTGTETSINHLVETMKHSLEFTPTVPHGPARTGEQMRSCLDISKAKISLGWQPQTSLSQGLTQTAQFFKTLP